MSFEEHRMFAKCEVPPLKSETFQADAAFVWKKRVSPFK